MTWIAVRRRPPSEREVRERRGPGATLVALTALLSLILVTLSSRATAATKVATSTPMPATTLRLAMPNAAPVIDPALVADEENALLATLLYGGLVRLDAHYHAVPALAQRWTISPDHRSYTFYLRPGLKFSNGDPITASDFRFSITRSLNPALKSPSAPTYLLDIEGASAVLSGKAKSVSGIKVLSSLSIQITARWPVPYFLTELTYPTSFALDEKRLAKTAPSESASWYSNPIVSGPYKLKSWTPNTQLVLVRNPNFPERRWVIPRVTISLGQIPSSDLYQFVTQNFDVAMVPPEDAYLRKMPDVHETKMLAIDGVYMNLKDKPLSDVKVRKALITAIRRSDLVRSTMGHGYTPFAGCVPPGEDGYSKTLRQYPFNPARARKALAAAGFSDGQKFPALTLYYPDDPLIAKLAAAIVASWHKSLHIVVDTKALTLNTLLAKVQSGSLPLYIGGWSADYPDPHDWLSLQWRSDAVNNNVHYGNANFDRVVETADVTWDRTQRMRLYDQAQQLLVNDVAWMPLYLPHRVEYIRSTVTNLVLTGFGLIPLHGDWASVRMIAAAPRRLS